MSKASPKARSARQPARFVALVVIGVATLLFLTALSVRVGAIGLSWKTFFHAYFHYTGTDDDLIVRKLREPRALVAVEVGAALAVAGTLVQGLTRNPLADSGLLGINAGAALFVVLGIGFFHAAAPSQFVFFAFAGAAVGTMLSLTLGIIGKGRPTPLKITLAGVIVASILGAFTSLMVYLSPAIAGNYSLWIVGDVGGRSLSVVYATAPAIIVGLLLALPLGRTLNNLSLGDDMARVLGQRVHLTRVMVVTAVVLLAGAAVAAAGPIAFVGLAIPNVLRTVIENDYRRLLPLAAIFGSVFLLGTDIVARIIDRPHEIETGVIVAAIGAPIFVILVSRRRLAQV